MNKSNNKENERKIRLLIVDDSFFMRELLKEMLKKHSFIDVVGDAKNGVEAIGQMIRLRPDVVTMDYNMPGMNGAQAIEEIIKLFPQNPPKIIMLSAYTEEGTKATLESLHAGAIDFIAKPSGELSFDIEKIEIELVSKIKVAASARVIVSQSIKLNPKVERDFEREVEVIIIGSSTGGPPLIENILKQMPKDCAIPIVVVQHLPESFSGAMSRRINDIVDINVKEAEDGEELLPGNAYFACGGKHLKIISGKQYPYKHFFEFSDEVARHGNLKPAIDVTLESAVKVYGERIFGIILTGMGNDGTEGFKLLREAGAYTVVQDPSTAVVGSMPQSAIDEGVVDDIFTPDKIVSRMISLCKK